MKMAAFESSEPSKSGGRPDTGKLIPLSSGPEFDWSMFDLYFKQYISQWPNAVVCLEYDIEKIDGANTPSASDKEKRHKLLRVPNQKVVGAIYSAAFG